MFYGGKWIPGIAPQPHCNLQSHKQPRHPAFSRNHYKLIHIPQYVLLPLIKKVIHIILTLNTTPILVHLSIVILLTFPAHMAQI
jgi:hypothetical protein